MKRIEFIAPVESMRGNLSGTQKDLVYPTNDNKAYDAPTGVRSYARNYQPIFVGAKRVSDGKKYFSVKTKTAVNITDKSQKAMALLGGTAAIIAAILRNKTGQVRLNCVTAFLYAKSQGEEHTGTLREFLTYKIKNALNMKRPGCFVARLSATQMFAIQNPWSSIEYDGASVISITNESLVKFWPLLADSPVVFEFEGLKGVAHNNDTFDNVVNSTYNVLDLRLQTIGSNEYVKSGSLYVQVCDTEETPLTWAFLKGEDNVYPYEGTSYIYRLTSEEPTA